MSFDTIQRQDSTADASDMNHAGGSTPAGRLSEPAAHGDGGTQARSRASLAWGPSCCLPPEFLATAAGRLRRISRALHAYASDGRRVPWAAYAPSAGVWPAATASSAPDARGEGPVV